MGMKFYDIDSALKVSLVPPLRDETFESYRLRAGMSVESVTRCDIPNAAIWFEDDQYRGVWMRFDGRVPDILNMWIERAKNEWFSDTSTRHDLKAALRWLAHEIASRDAVVTTLQLGWTAVRDEELKALRQIGDAVGAAALDLTVAPPPGGWACLPADELAGLKRDLETAKANVAELRRVTPTCAEREARRLYAMQDDNVFSFDHDEARDLLIEAANVLRLLPANVSPEHREIARRHRATLRIAHVKTDRSDLKEALAWASYEMPVERSWLIWIVPS